MNYRAVQKQLKTEIARNPQRLNTLLRLVNTARNLERIADHAAKIAESVVYLKEGEILRDQWGRPSLQIGTDEPATMPLERFP